MASSILPKPPAATSEWVRRGRSKIHGGGLYAQKAIVAGTKVIEYVGERITKVEAQRRENRRLTQRDSGRAGCVYVFEINQRYDVDGDVSWNPARLINHSCDGNCEPQNIRGHIWIVALRDIAAGEEITYDYGFDFADWQNHPCRCGSRKCAGYIVIRGQRWRLRKALRALRTK